MSLLERSDDDGITWTRADRGLGTDALFFMPEIGPGNTLALTVVHPSTPAGPYAAELWTSPDAGQTWRLGSTLPEYPGPIMLAAPAQPGVAWPTLAQPFYALEEEQTPSDLTASVCCRAEMANTGRSCRFCPCLAPAPSGVESCRCWRCCRMGDWPSGALIPGVDCLRLTGSMSRCLHSGCGCGTQSRDNGKHFHSP